MVSLNLITAIAFYSIIVFIIIKFKDKFDFEAKFIALYRTKFGIKLMDRFAKKFPGFVKVMGYIGVAVGFAGMVFIAWFLIDNMYKLLAVPDTAAGVSIVLPGVPIPGSPIFIPFWSGIISIFIIAAVHEFSHGIVAKRFKVAVKNSGIVFFGPLIGAFVEPDEKQLANISKKKQLAMFAAGSWSNIILALVALLLLSFVVAPIWVNALDMNRLKIYDVSKDMPAYDAGLREGDIITKVNGIDIYTTQNFTEAIDSTKPGDQLIITTEKRDYSLTTQPHPKNDSISIIGVNIYQDLKKEVTGKWGAKLPWIWYYLLNFLRILGLLSAGIGLANLLPISIFDGGRMFRIFSDYAFKKKAFVVSAYVSSLFIFLLLFNIAVPFLRLIF
ncbi:site-2 protease family protein [Candidatus Woesearchaeota archaeon]|nr:site-2 protease family protein [Candidatus Woesearchaeota archaeon]